MAILVLISVFDLASSLNVLQRYLYLSTCSRRLPLRVMLICVLSADRAQAIVLVLSALTIIPYFAGFSCRQVLLTLIARVHWTLPRLCCQQAGVWQLSVLLVELLLQNAPELLAQFLQHTR